MKGAGDFVKNCFERGVRIEISGMQSRKQGIRKKMNINNYTIY